MSRFTALSALFGDLFNHRSWMPAELAPLLIINWPLSCKLIVGAETPELSSIGQLIHFWSSHCTCLLFITFTSSRFLDWFPGPVIWKNCVGRNFSFPACLHFIYLLWVSNLTTPHESMTLRVGITSNLVG
jgi:hypothetical protein